MKTLLFALVCALVLIGMSVHYGQVFPALVLTFVSLFLIRSIVDKTSDEDL